MPLSNDAFWSESAIAAHRALRARALGAGRRRRGGRRGNHSGGSLQRELQQSGFRHGLSLVNQSRRCVATAVTVPLSPA